MKTKIVSIIMLAGLLHFAANAQTKTGFETKSGVYMTFTDFQAKKLNLEADRENQKIKVHDVFSKSYFDVIHEGKKYTFQKNETYGIRDKNGRDFRFFNNKEYLISDTGAIYIYSIEEIISSSHASGKRITKYFFSAQGNSEIIPLTLLNLKKVLPENKILPDKLDAQFSTDAQLIEYDQFHKTFKINHFLSNNLK